MPLDLATYLIMVAQAVALRSPCRRKVGCVLADEKGKILASGYNGPPSGVAHCDERGCDPLRQHHCSAAEQPGCSCSVRSNSCDAIHAEQNALIQCNDVSKVHFVAVTRAPCLTCTRMLLNSGAVEVLFSEGSSYPAAETYFLNARHNKNMKASWTLVKGAN
jgi:dCMP deaminase